MIKVPCPNCGVRLTAADELLDKPVTCQKCASTFVLSTRWTNEATEPGVPMTPEAAAAAGSKIPSAKPPTRPTQAPTPSAHSPTPSTRPAKSNSQPTFLPANDATLGATPGAKPKPAPNPEPATASPPVPASPPIPMASRQPTANTASQIPTAIPNSSVISTPEPIPNTTFRSISRAESAERRGKPVVDGFVEARSPLEFFDFRFRRYLTPSILKVSWLLVLALSLIWLLITTWAFASAISGGETFVRSNDLIRTLTQNTSPFVVSCAIYATAVVSLVFTLLWIRVLFETIFLGFSIANTMRTIAHNSARSDEPKG